MNCLKELSNKKSTAVEPVNPDAPVTQTNPCPFVTLSVISLPHE